MFAVCNLECVKKRQSGAETQEEPRGRLAMHRIQLFVLTEVREGVFLVLSKIRTFILLNDSGRNALFLMFLLGVFKSFYVQDASWIFVTLTKILERE